MLDISQSRANTAVAQQLPLLELQGVNTKIPRTLESNQERFDWFHANNPHVYRNLRALALAMKTKRGKKRVGIKMLYEVLRYQYDIHTAGEEEFKLNNNYTAYYARLLMAQEPDLAGLFEVREIRSH
jgi:hypothetical protein